jgi:membrane-associated PAP2 superfamily phosphatase
VLQAVLVATAVWLAGRQLAPGRLLWLVPLVLLTSAPFHAGQFMPDALTGAVVLFAWSAAARDPAASGAPLLWLGAILATLVHYTHLALLVTTGVATIGAALLFGLAWRAAARRAVALLLAIAAVLGAHVAANGLALGRWSVSPMGGVFLFARLYEDGPAVAWLDAHCGRDAPAPLCAARASLPRDSQKLLWSNERSPLARHLWQGHERERWAWAEMVSTAARGALSEAPAAVAHAALRGAANQFSSFAALDDECPVGCRDPRAGITSAIVTLRPEAAPSLAASRQVRNETAKPLLRAITTPLAWLSIALLPVAAVVSWRRRDALGLGLIAAIGLGLVVNAGLAGALSDVHDRYQSRLVWLAPLAVVLVALRAAQTFRRWRISLPGLK